ncbi:MAG: DUF4160 domain-containing protein [Rectinemataceae bacterium]
MPTISMFYGILIRMYSGQREHPSAHFHARYSEHGAIFDILSGELIEGAMPLRQCRLISAWVEIRRDELLADWSLAQAQDALFTIDPLK